MSTYSFRLYVNPHPTESLKPYLYFKTKNTVTIISCTHTIRFLLSNPSPKSFLIIVLFYPFPILLVRNLITMQTEQNNISLNIGKSFYHLIIGIHAEFNGNSRCSFRYNFQYTTIYIIDISSIILIIAIFSYSNSTLYFNS